MSTTKWIAGGMVVFTIGLFVGHGLWPLAVPDADQAAPEVVTKTVPTFDDSEFSFQAPAGFLIAREERGALHLVPSDHDGLPGSSDEIFVSVRENPEGLEMDEYLQQSSCGTSGSERPLEINTFINDVGEAVYFVREDCEISLGDRYVIADGDRILVAVASYARSGDPIQAVLRSIAETLAPLDIHDRLYPGL